MNKRKFQAECRRLMWRSIRRDWWLRLASLAVKVCFFNTARTMMKMAEESHLKDQAEFNQLLRDKEDAAARTLRA